MPLFKPTFKPLFQFRGQLLLSVAIIFFVCFPNNLNQAAAVSLSRVFCAEDMNQCVLRFREFPRLGSCLSLLLFLFFS